MFLERNKGLFSIDSTPHVNLKNGTNFTFKYIYGNGRFKQGLVAKMEMIVIVRYPLW